MLYEVTSTIEERASFRYQRREELGATQSSYLAKVKRFPAMFETNTYPQSISKGRQPREDEKKKKYPWVPVLQQRKFRGYQLSRRRLRRNFHVRGTEWQNVCLHSSAT